MKINSTPRKTELLAPAGSLETGMTAFAAGADAVYVGLPRFSARKNAVNFSCDDLRRLKTSALQRNGRIYLAVNTVIKEEEVPELIPAIQEAVWAGADALIVQDIGAAQLIRDTFPDLPLHASTQMAIHNAAGICEASRLGFSRVVLARECGKTTIEKLRQECPDMELEVFIHGALCYSFSGICLASGLLLGRSGNRGECAQLCRNWYQTPQGKAFALSCNDLALENDVIKLRDIGVASLKIEGRMKNAEYVHHTVKFYRELLDGNASREDMFQAELAKNVALTFQRKKTKGYFIAPAGQNLIDPRFSEHKGIEIGQISGVETIPSGPNPEFDLELKLQGDLSRHDSLQILLENEIQKPLRSSAREISIKRDSSWRSVIHAKTGDCVRIRIKPSHDKASGFSEPFSIPVGTSVFLTRSTELRTPSISDTSFAPWKKPVLMNFTISSISKRLPDPSALISWRLEEKQGSFTVTLDRARTSKNFRPLFTEAICEQGQSPFSIGILQWTNNTSLDDQSLFIPPSELKELRNQCHLFVRQWASERLKELTPADSPSIDVPVLSLEGRAICSPKERDPSLPIIPCFDEEDLKALATQTCDREPSFVRGSLHLPLSPIIFDETTALTSLRQIVSTASSPIALGLNNIAQIGWLRTLLQEFGPAKVHWWLDAYFYAANRSVLATVMRLLGPEAPLPLAQMAWVEGDDQGENARIFPAMVSMGCLTRHESARSLCPSSCTRKRFMVFKNGSQKFNVRIHHCRTYIFLH